MLKNGDTILFRYGGKVYKGSIKGFAAFSGRSFFYIVETKARPEVGYEYDCILVAPSAIIPKASNYIEVLGYETK